MFSTEDKTELFKAILSLDSSKECEEFFNDLCTIKEVEAMAQRFKAAKMFDEKKTYENIIEMTDISSATLSRVSKSYQYGNGYRNVIEKMKKKAEEEKK